METMEQCAVSDPVPPWDTGPVFSMDDPYFMEWVRLRGHADYNRTAVTTVKLYTGHKRHRSERLFGVWAPANKITDKRALPSYPAEKKILINYDRIRVGALGSPGNDYYLYKMLPADATIDLTVQVNGEQFYDYFLSQQPYDVDINANDVPLDPDTVADNAIFCVGQNIIFKPVFTPTLPAGTVPSFPRWVLSGEFINQTNSPSPSDASPTYVVNDSILSQVSTHAWWVSGGFDPETYKAKFGEGLTFANGNYVVVAAKGLFKMHRPRLTNYTWTEVDYGKVGPALLHWNHPGEPAPPAILPPPYRDELRVYPSAYFAVNVDVGQGFSGRAINTQTLNGHMLSEAGGLDTHNTSYLDNNEIYNGFSVPGNLVWFRDTPSKTCGGNTDVHLDFMVFVRFKPDQGPGPNIYATLGFVHWHMYESTGLADIGDGRMDYTPFPREDSDLPIIVTAQPGEADIDEWISSANSFPWWTHTAVTQ